VFYFIIRHSVFDVRHFFISQRLNLIALQPEPVDGWYVKALPAMLRRGAQHDTYHTNKLVISKLPNHERKATGSFLFPKTNGSTAIKRQPRYPLYCVPLLSGLGCRAIATPDCHCYCNCHSIIPRYAAAVGFRLPGHCYLLTAVATATATQLFPSTYLSETVNH